MPTTVLSQAPLGATTQSSSVSPPSPPPGFVLASGVLTDADAADPALSCILYVEASWDGSTWLGVDGGGGLWQGGSRAKDGVSYQRPGSNPSFPLDALGDPPLAVRLVIDPRGTGLNVGGTIGWK